MFERLRKFFYGEEQEMIARKDSDGNWYISKDSLNGKPYNPDTATETEKNSHRILEGLLKKVTEDR